MGEELKEFMIAKYWQFVDKNLTVFNNWCTMSDTWKWSYPAPAPTHSKLY